MFSQHSLNRPMLKRIVLVSFTDCCRFASPAASQLPNLFHVRSGENKCRLRRRLFSFLATKRKHPAERLPGAGILYRCQFHREQQMIPIICFGALPRVSQNFYAVTSASKVNVTL